MTPRSRWEHKHRLYREQKGVCAYCGLYVKYNQWTLEHIIPKHSGGSSLASNLVGACMTCNTLKGGLTTGVLYYQIRKMFELNIDRLVRAA